MTLKPRIARSCLLSHPHWPLLPLLTRVVPVIATKIPWMLRTMPSVSQSEMFRDIRMPSQGLRTRVHSNAGEGNKRGSAPIPSRKELVEPRHQAAQSSNGDKGPFVPPSPGDREELGPGGRRSLAPTGGGGRVAGRRGWQVGA